MDLWAEVIAEEETEHNLKQQQQPNVQGIYQRRRRKTAQSQQQYKTTPTDATATFNSMQVQSSNEDNRVSFAAVGIKRISWTRSLSTRGRLSIAVTACVNDIPHQKHAKNKGKGKGKGKGKPPVPKGKTVQAPDFEKERKYFEEVDAFELMEESPSPNNFSTWTTSDQTDTTAIPNVSSRLEKWLISKTLNFNYEPNSTLSKILETPIMPMELATPKPRPSVNLDLHSVKSRLNSYAPSRGAMLKESDNGKTTSMLAGLQSNDSEGIEAVVERLSLTSEYASPCYDNLDPFAALLAVCGQSAPTGLLDVLSKYSEPEDIAKVGEGTFGEAFKAGNTVCKIVPIDGDLQVNGEVQKRSEELLEEVILSRTLNNLRRHECDAYNACTTFIETLDLRVCQGPYDSALIKAWETWDENHGSENDHPKDFSEKQRYVVFVLQHGGKDLESFVLLNFDEARSLLAQVTAALAVAEAAYEFEHRDLHWGNILLSRGDTAMLQYNLEGNQIFVRTYGLVVSIIDFTLSRINTGEDILFLDLSSDPDLFKGPKGDRQAETYRMMKEVTKDCWERSFPRTNVLWLLYLVDILLLKKSFERSSKHERDLRALKKRLDKYDSAKEAIFDPFFIDFVDCAQQNEEKQ